MGVPYLYKFIRDKYNTVLRRNVPSFVSSFSLDMNGILHKQAQLVYAYGEGTDPVRRKLVEQADPKMLEAEYHNAIAVKLQEILAQVQPTEIFVIAVDGVAPQAKIAQQRQRRFKNAMERGEKTPFDPNCLSPGTEFMIRLDNFLQRWIVANQAILPPKVIYSSHMVPAEGEHKIMDFMRSGEISGEGAHVFYGMDADLIMLSMLAPLNKISLMREDIRDVIDIDTFKEVIKTQMGSESGIHDYVVMMFMLGNDFLPHVPSLEDMDSSISLLIEIYIKTNKPLTSNGNINWEGLSSFLTNLGSHEPTLLEHEATRDVKFPSRMLAAASTRTEKIEEGTKMLIGKKITFHTVLDYNLFRGAWYQNELIPKSNEVFKKLLPGYNFGITTEKVVAMCQEYLLGIGWVYNYYIKGTDAINSDYVYRYHHTPLLTDLASVLSQVKSVEGYLAHPNQVVLNPIHQLLAILPLKSKDLLPREISHLMSKDSPISDMYPENIVVELDGKNAEWQGIVLIPFIEAERIITAVNTTTVFSVERAALYTQGSNVVMIKDPELIALEAQKKQFRQYMNQQKQGNYQGRGRGNYQQGGRGYQRQDQQPRDYQQGNYQGNYQGRGRGNYQQGNYQNRDQRQDQQAGRGNYQNREQQGGREQGYKSPRRNTVLNPTASEWKPSPRQEQASQGLPPINQPIQGLPPVTQTYTQPIQGLPPIQGLQGLPPLAPPSREGKVTGWKKNTTIL